MELNGQVVLRALVVSQFPEDRGQAAMSVDVTRIDPQGRFVVCLRRLQVFLTDEQVGKVRIPPRIVGMMSNCRRVCESKRQLM